MVTAGEWTGGGWRFWKEKRAPRPEEHRGIEFFDRERMRQPLQPIVQPLSFEEYAAPPSFVTLPESWGPWEPMPAGYFHNGPIAPKAAIVDGAERETTDYVLRRAPEDVAFPWRVAFANAVFQFRTLAIAEAAIVELLKIRKAKHPKPDTLSKRTPSCVFFTANRRRGLPEDKTAIEEKEAVAA
jgi:hypothetical protein